MTNLGTKRPTRTAMKGSSLNGGLLRTTLLLTLLIAETSGRENRLKQWIRSRVGPSGNAIWAYQGALYDPLNGEKIANVQGLELVRCLGETDDTKASKQAFVERCGDLVAGNAIQELLQLEAAASTKKQQPSSLEYAGTILSRKLFCYTDPTEDGNTQTTSAREDGGARLIKHFRLRPNSPVRRIPTEQAATVFDTATTIVQKKGKAAANEWLVHTEWPDGRVVWSNTRVSSASDAAHAGSVTMSSSNAEAGQDILEFSAYARAPSRKGMRFPDLTSSVSTNAAPSRRRLSWIQFGRGSAGRNFGARETYAYNLDKMSTVRYTRYGEGPAWYGPGRLCTLELTGRRIDSLEELPSAIGVARQVAYDKVLGFLSVNAPVSRDNELAANAVEWFRGKGSALLQVAPVASLDEEKHGVGPTAREQWVEGVEQKGGALWNRLRSAASLGFK